MDEVCNKCHWDFWEGQMWHFACEPSFPVEPSLEVGLDMISFKFDGLQRAEQIVYIEGIWLNGNLGKHTWKVRGPSWCRNSARSMCAPCAEHFPWLDPTRVTHSSRCAFTHAATASSLLEHFGWSKAIGIYAENCGSSRHRRCNHQCVQALLVLPTDIPGLWSPASMPLLTGVNSYLYCFESFCNNPVVSEGSCNNTAGHSLWCWAGKRWLLLREAQSLRPIPSMAQCWLSGTWQLGSHAEHEGCAASALTSAVWVDSIVSALQSTHKWMVMISGHSGLGWLLN